MSDSDFDTVSWSFDDERGIAEVTLDRPDAMNAIDERMQREVIEVFDRLEALDDEADGVAVSAVVLDHAGDRAFSSGLDLTEMEGLETHDDRKLVPDLFCEATDAIESYDAPVIAKIDERMQREIIEVFDRLEALDDEADGVAVSAVVLSAAGDRAFSSGLDLDEMEGLETHDDRKLVPDLFCEATDAIESYDAPVIAKVDGLCLGGGFEFADTLASKPPLALRGIKDAANETRQTGYEEALDYGGHIWVSLSQTEDFAEGMAAHAEDREPEYVGR